MNEDILLTFELLLQIEPELPVAALWNKSKFNRYRESVEDYDYPVEIVDGLRWGGGPNDGKIAPPKAKNSVIVKIKPLAKKNLKERWVTLDSLKLSKHKLPKCLTTSNETNCSLTNKNNGK